MGNVVGTISFDSVEHHRFHKLVIDNMKTYGLDEANPNHSSFIPDNKDTYSVNISGLKLWWLGDQAAYNKITTFLLETKYALLKDGATNVEMQIDRLPL
uniref:Uncharacterized protein n=1 Tax=viral metagenome TaxID=1070528 RepID=A0A6C0JU06_9ZZZZ